MTGCSQVASCNNDDDCDDDCDDTINAQMYIHSPRDQRTRKVCISSPSTLFLNSKCDFTKKVQRMQQDEWFIATQIDKRSEAAKMTPGSLA